MPSFPICPNQKLPRRMRGGIHAVEALCVEIGDFLPVEFNGNGWSGSYGSYHLTVELVSGPCGTIDDPGNGTARLRWSIDLCGSGEIQVDANWNQFVAHGLDTGLSSACCPDPYAKDVWIGVDTGPIEATGEPPIVVPGCVAAFPKDCCPTSGLPAQGGLSPSGGPVANRPWNQSSGSIRETQPTGPSCPTCGGGAAPAGQACCGASNSGPGGGGCSATACTRPTVISAEPVRYATGELVFEQVDLQVVGFGTGWGHML